MSLVALAAVYTSTGGAEQGCPVCPNWCDDDVKSQLQDVVYTSKAIVTHRAMGARAAVTGDFDGDGHLDLVSASSLNNVVEWCRPPLACLFRR